MSCDIKYDNIIFSVQKKSRFNNTENYVFIGTVDSIIYNILLKLENRKGINKEEVLLLKKTYPNDYNDWINIVKDKIKIKFIQNKIHIDDSINEIRKKIFIFLSNLEEKIFILPENQELSLKTNNGKSEIIGYCYENIKTKEKDISIPHILENVKFNNINHFDSSHFKKNTSENNLLIYDLLDNSKYLKKIIYLSDAKEEEKFLKLNKINITEELINNYFKKYWPYVNLNYNVEDVKNNYLLTKDYYVKENYIFDLINNIPNNNEKFGSCNILTIKLNVNNNDNDYDNEYDNSMNSEYIDLFPIFDYIKDQKIDEKTPFLRYSEDILEAPFSLISKKAIDNNLVNQDLLIKWMGINQPQRRMNSIVIKRYLKDYNNIPRYSSISLYKTGKLTINVSFKEENCATFSDIEYTIKNCKKIIEDINKNRIVKKKEEKQKIEVPDLDIVNNNIIFKKNTKIIYMNITIPIKFNANFDFKKMSEFSKKFPYFLAEFPKNLLKKDENRTENSIRFKYKRISAFANMNDILLEIDLLKQKYDKDIGFIIKSLEKKYQKSIDEIKGYLLEWEKKYSSSKSLKISPEFRTGILVTISNNSIIIHGITKLYQIPLVYKFFVTFLTLFINYDDFLKNKNFKKLFVGKDLNMNTINYDNSYEYNNNVIINIDKIYNTDYDLDNEILLDDELEYIEKDDYEIIEKQDKNTILGLASENELGKDIKLVCEDAISEKGTCKDLCNDEKYFLRRLQTYDNPLFKFDIDKKGKQKQYSRGCQQANKQPIVLPYDPSTNKSVKRDSYTYSVKYSSDPIIRDRWYICPKIWCPYCEIPISESDINPKTIQVRATKEQGGTCKTALCPFGDHQVFIREKDNETFIYPGFLDATFHPKGLCLPCCFKKSQENPKSKFYKGFKKCIGDDVENDIIKDGKIYILSKGIPIDKDRYGKLNLEIAKILKTDLEKGYLEFNSGYLRKGIKHEKNNSFLSAICDILSCDKINLKIDISKIKNILIEKINEDLFKSLHSGNLQNIFKNPKSELTPFQNYKKYILNNKIDINHVYLWDFLQRDNIIFENGINIFIFENNNLLCPKGENINYFYDITKKSILLIKSKDYYEPIYYLEGDGKGAKTICIFNYDNEEIRKIFDISFNGCKNYDDIDWLTILKENIQKYDINIDNITLSNGDDLQDVLNKLLINIKNNKLNSGYLPELQYIDSYNKVFAIKLNNGLYLPVKPSKLIEKIKYKIISDINEINKMDIKNIIKYTNEINNVTKLNCKITHKILDISTKKNIIALVNENNRIIPIKKILNVNNGLKLSNLNYYSDVDESLENKIQKTDNRIEQINKKNFEDETYIRMKFELSNFLQIKDNKKYLNDILEIINIGNKDINNERKKLYKILDNIYSELISDKDKNIDYYNYKVPNKRVPCFLRNTKKYNKDDNIKLSCNDDPHCITSKNSCKLYLNNKNLLNIHKKFDNYNYYLSKIVDELLRYKMKRNEILYNNIPIIINKELIEPNNEKYIVIHSINYNEINNIIEKLFLDNKGLFIDNRNLYEEITTKDISFKKEKYIKTNAVIIKNNKTEDLSVFWNKLLGNKFKININENIGLLSLISNILNVDEFKKNENEKIDIIILKNNIINYIKNKIIKKNINVIEIYKKSENKLFKSITSLESLFENINNESYEGCDIDLEFISKIYNINIIILDKRIKKGHSGYKFIKSNNNSMYYLILYKSIIFENIVYNIIQNKNKVIFKINDLPEKFLGYIVNINHK